METMSFSKFSIVLLLIFPPLLRYLIKGLSNKGDVVADFFCGSGTSLVVAKELGRSYIGCDINPRAIEITKSRLKEIEDGKK